MTNTIQIPHAAFELYAFASKRGSGRDNLEYVAIEFDGNGAAIAIATDGHRLHTVDWVAPDTDERTFYITADDAKEVASFVRKGALRSGYWAGTFEDLAMRCEMVGAPPLKINVYDKLEAGYPDWRQAVPDHRDDGTEAAIFGCNLQYLADLAKWHKRIGGMKEVRIQPGATSREPVRITPAPNDHDFEWMHTIMPCRL